MSELKNRYDFMLVFDVKDGNPNGDPDAGNQPRVDAETGQGLITDVCIKRKVRNYIQLAKGGIEGYDIFIKEKAILNASISDAYAKLGIDLGKPPADSKDGKQRTKKGHGSEVTQARQKMCADFFDIRTFGAVLSTGANAGQVRGPVQLTFARSIDPINALEHAITRVAITKAEDAEKSNEMGRKHTVPYGLYVAYGFVSPALAHQTGFSEEDLAEFWQALKVMFDHDHSAARGLMATQRLIIFKHASALGNAASHELFDLVTITRKPDVAVPRSFSDYTVNVRADALPAGVELL